MPSSSDRPLRRAEVERRPRASRAARRRRRASGGSTSTSRRTSSSGSSARCSGSTRWRSRTRCTSVSAPSSTSTTTSSFLVVYGAAPDEDDLVEVHCFYSERYLVTVRRDDCPAFAEARERHARRPERLERAGARPLPRRRRPGRQLLPAPLRRGRLHRRGRGGDLHAARPGAAAPRLPDEAPSGRSAPGDRAANATSSPASRAASPSCPA